MKILVLTSRFPYPAVGGDKLRAFNIIRHLAARFTVDVFSLYWNDAEIAERAGLEAHCRAVHVYPLSRARRFWNTAVGWLRGLPLQTGYYTDLFARRRLRKVLREGDYDVVVVHLVRMLDYVRGVVPADRVVLELTDAISMNYRRIGRPRTPRELLYVFERARLLRYEIRALEKHVSAGVLVGDVDSRYLAEHGAPEGRMHVIRNGTDLAGAPRAASHVGGRVLFLGNMRTAQNEDMAMWFAEEIFPLVRAERPDAEFVIAGANPSRRLHALDGRDGVRVTGPVDDPAAVLGTARVTVCPMRYGAGLQNKILESMAVGVPVVATPAGAEGLGARDGEDLLVSDTARGIADAVLRVLRDDALHARLSGNGASFIARNFRWEDQMDAYAGLLERVARTASARGGGG